MKLMPIGIVHSPYITPKEAPNQGRYSDKIAELEIYPDYLPGLKSLSEATHLIVLYWCHLARRDILQTVTPFGPEIKGVFACRSPHRPNPIAFCVVELLKVEENRLTVRGIDAIDGSPLLDIKPYFPKLDSV
ncbi:MAG: tRNA (N6-threonylcarbamoyladenosine(37)-N6)-methyltransferase TrmO [Caldisericum exile]|uniref:tRNA (N6-threonylcarbamoyladenosine(37)-N6)-methyltransferase TrmO n=1 Tax=Caldisericum exile TaxID=693075 RepID=UPI003C79273F